MFTTVDLSLNTLGKSTVSPHYQPRCFFG